VTENKIAFITHPKSGMHIQPFPRPHLESFESPLRVQMATAYLKRIGILNELKEIKAPRAKVENVLTVHSPYLVDTVTIMSELGSGGIGDAAYASPDLLRNSLLAVGGAMEAAKIVSNDEVKHAFSMMRPPGHHASSSTAAGLCYFNNLAIATKRVLEKPDVKRVTIFDFDDHFGNGTSEIFYSDPNVQYISIHEYDYENFGIGHYEEVGFGKGRGTNINIPFVDGTSDISYQSAIEKIVVPAIESFKPDMIAVSAGFDSHYADPVGNMNIDSSTFWHIGTVIKKLVTEQKMQGSFFTLEGGYNPFVLGTSIHALLDGLLGKSSPKLEDQVEREIHDQITDTNDNIIQQVLDTHNQFR